MSLEKGLFIVIEGADGSGTTSQTAFLSDYIKNTLQFSDFISTFEPTDGVYGSIIRKTLKKKMEADPEELAELFVLDSVRNNRYIIKPMREKGGIVLSDRYRPSSFAYQPSAGVSPEYITELHERKAEKLEIPNITFYLDVTGEICMERSKLRGEKLEIFENREFQEKVIKRYQDLIESELKYFGKVIPINAMNCKEEVSEEIQSKFLDIYNNWKIS